MRSGGEEGREEEEGWRVVVERVHVRTISGGLGSSHCSVTRADEEVEKEADDGTVDDDDE